MKLGDKLWHRRLRRWEPYDSITIEQEPRLKTSGLSGDEWRTGVKVTLWFKGQAIVEEFYNSYDFALANVTALVTHHSEPIEKKVIDIERECCDQPSCAEKAVSVYALKKLFSEQGDPLDMSEMSHARYYRQFCARHLYRGDCSREDCDSNYEVLSGPGPHDSQARPEDESPSGVVVVDATEVL